MTGLVSKPVVWAELARASVLESLRRKDLWVAVILAGLMIGAASVVGRFGVAGLDMFLKDVTLTIVNLLTIVLAVLFSARQLPEEISRRTIYPLLARPITRFDLIFGKFLGGFALSACGLVIFCALGWLVLKSFGLAVGAIFFQYFLLRLCSLAVICALTLSLSLFLTPQATVTVSLLLTIGASTFSDAVKLLHETTTGFSGKLLEIAYFALPQLDLFDLSKKVSYAWPPIDPKMILFLVGYASVHTAICLAIGTARFQKMPL